MKEINEILKELNELKSPLGAASREMPFAVPDGYFAGLAANLAGEAFADGMELPEDVFSKQQPFKIPDGYLEALPAQLLAAAKAADPVAVRQRRTIPLRMPASKLIRFAAAAVLVLGLGIGSYKLYQVRTPDGKAAHQLAKVDADTLGNYVMQHIDEFDAESLEHEVATTQTDVHTAVSQLNDAEIEEYLNEHGEAAPGHVN